MRATARKALAPQCVRVIELTEQPFFQAIFDLEVPRMAQGRAAILGDAAFVARPHVGMGVTKAALDAQCLSEALSGTDDIAHALARYNARQHVFGARVIARARLHRRPSRGARDQAAGRVDAQERIRIRCS